MRNEFTAIIERDGDGTSPIALRFLVQTGRDKPRMKLGRTWQKRSNLSSRTGERMRSVEFRPTRRSHCRSWESHRKGKNRKISGVWSLTITFNLSLTCLMFTSFSPFH